ncbi:hypothetical protein FA13DRAFT_102106 [Coprinellus micaceus]|uniref:Uncharacterized protein n=1 Tax=Coprinellus micaceus TaxID=71717 RepID=A0A4Y7SIC2_COPMI|nr:hypothetical protein FA13DRAFT_102106 [Coprinellus micaceus]
MQALHDRVLQVQLSSQTASTRLTGTGSTPSEPPRRTVHTQPLPQDVSAHPSPYSGTVTGTGRDSSTPWGQAAFPDFRPQGPHPVLRYRRRRALGVRRTLRTAPGRSLRRSSPYASPDKARASRHWVRR